MPSLAQDQDGDIRRRHHLDLFDNFLPRSASANHLADFPKRFSFSIKPRGGHDLELIRPGDPASVPISSSQDALAILPEARQCLSSCTIASRIAFSNYASSKGLVKNSNAPALIARTDVGMSPWPVRKIVGI